jgi:hypothetical protein
LNVVDYVKVIEELARMDGSVGWCASIGASYSRLAGYLPPGIANRIFGGGGTVIAGQLMATGKAVAVAGGYRVSGRWAFGSGIEHSDWTIGICVVHDGDAPRLEPDGAPVERLAFFPTGAVEIIDTCMSRACAAPVVTTTASPTCSFPKIIRLKSSHRCRRRQVRSMRYRSGRCSALRLLPQPSGSRAVQLMHFKSWPPPEAKEAGLGGCATRRPFKAMLGALSHSCARPAPFFSKRLRKLGTK